MIIEIPKISPDGSRYAGEDPAELLDLANDPNFHPRGPIRYDLFAAVVTGGLVVQGRVETDFELQCGRCAVLFSTSVADSAFIRDYPLQEGQQDVDLSADLREAVLLQLPAYPVCGEHCRGLCPHCARNLNEGTCGCAPEPPAASGAWEALDGLKL